MQVQNVYYWFYTIILGMILYSYFIKIIISYTLICIIKILIFMVNEKKSLEKSIDHDYVLYYSVCVKKYNPTVAKNSSVSHRFVLYSVIPYNIVYNKGVWL